MTSSKAQVSLKKTILCGRKAILEVIHHKRELLSELYLQKGIKLDSTFSNHLRSLVSDGLTVKEIKREELDRLSSGAKHQGILAVITNTPSLGFKELIEHSKNNAGVLVILDQVVDPQNLGSILRASEALGADGVVTTTRRSAPLSSAAKKASSGASELLPICSITNLADAIRKLKKAGFFVVGTVPNKNTTSVCDYNFTFPLALVLGSEGKGMRRLTREACDVLVQIPMKGQVESLNVGQACAVVLFELFKQKMYRNS